MFAINSRCENCRYCDVWGSTASSPEEIFCIQEMDEYMATEEELAEIPEMCDENGEPLVCPKYKPIPEQSPIDPYFYEESWDR